MWIVCSEVINLGGGKFLPHSKKVQVPEKLGNELVERGVATEAEIEKMEGYVASTQGEGDDNEDNDGGEDNGEGGNDGEGNEDAGSGQEAQTQA